MYSFVISFRRLFKLIGRFILSIIEVEVIVIFSVNLEFKEDDGKGSYSICFKDKNIFKFRCDYDKKIVIFVI